MLIYFEATNLNFLCTPRFITSLGANIFSTPCAVHTLQAQLVFFLQISDEVLQMQNRRQNYTECIFNHVLERKKIHVRFAKANLSSCIGVFVLAL